MGGCLKRCTIKKMFKQISNLIFPILFDAMLDPDLSMEYYITNYAGLHKIITITSNIKRIPFNTTSIQDKIRALVCSYFAYLIIYLKFDIYGQGKIRFSYQ